MSGCFIREMEQIEKSCMSETELSSQSDLTQLQLFYTQQIMGVK